MQPRTERGIVPEQDTAQDDNGGESIDYSKSQSEVNKQKDKAHDADVKRLAEEHASKA
jgi:hypothetical protein